MSNSIHIEPVHISLVGSHGHGDIKEPKDCEVCGHADWGDVLVNGVCGKCLYRYYSLVLDMFAAIVEICKDEKRKDDISNG